MSIVSRIVAGQHIGIGEKIKLNSVTAACGVDWKEDWPCDETADQANDRCNLEEAEQQVAIHRLMVQDVGVWNLIECPNPVEETTW